MMWRKRCLLVKCVCLFVCVYVFTHKSKQQESEGMQFGARVCVSHIQVTPADFFFLIIDVSATVSVCMYVCACVSIFLHLCVFAVLSLCVCVCVLCEEASVGCSFISSGSSCVECSSGGALCPAADAARAPAACSNLWLKCMNTHTHTRTHAVSKGQWPGFRTRLSAARRCQRMLVESVELSHTQALTFSRSGQLKSNNNWQLHRNTHTHTHTHFLSFFL